MKRAKKSILTVIVAGLLFAVFLAVWVLTRPFVDVTVYDRDATMSGYTLFAPMVDDTGYERETSEIYLLDMEGNIVHTWEVLGAIQQVKMKPDGNLVYATKDRAFVKRAGIREIDPYGNELWYYPVAADHDFYMYENGNILIHYLENVEVPRIGDGELWCPRMVEITREKEVVWEWRGEEHIDELTQLVGVTFPLGEKAKWITDWAHNNSCEVIGENDAYARDPRFKPGNIFFSYCNLNTIGVIDRDSGDIVWAWGPGELDGQHNPTMLDNGNILIFDNGTQRGYSRIIQLDPITEEIVWEYNDVDASKPRFFSPYVSSCQLLSNDNIFVCQGGYPRGYVNMLPYRVVAKVRGAEFLTSRFFEITQEGKIVWDCTITRTDRVEWGVYQAARYSAPYLRPLLDAVDALEHDESRRLRALPYLR